MSSSEVRVAESEIPSVLVYDVGGSHVSAAVCRAGDYQLGQVVSAPHPQEETSDAFVALLHALGVRANPNAQTVLGAGIAMPGPFDYAAGISRMRHKLPYLFGVDLRAALSARFHWRPEQIRFLNDAAAYLLGEVGAGAARGFSRAVAITLGTGIGCAFAVEGRVVTQGRGVPPGGEIWNLPYEGKTVEDYLSTRALQQSFREQTDKESEVSAIAAAAAAGDAVACEVFAAFGRTLGRALRHLLAEFEPQVVVLGGGIARSSSLFLPAAMRELDGLHMNLRITALDSRAPLAGAGLAWFSS
ncbi:MAG TPA: ROK family protein [Terracidiphilus sp.]|nr:ROK family protein [Terracidiphilus sp.]